MKKSKIEWSAVLICEIVFGFDGVIFTILGVSFGVFIEKIAASPNSRGNVYILPWVFGSIGVVFLIVFLFLFSVERKRKAARRRLIENGNYITARVTEVQQDYSVRINNRHPYYVLCEGPDPDTGEPMLYRSANVMEDPSYLLGQHLRVFVDTEPPRDYYVELDWGEW